MKELRLAGLRESLALRPGDGGRLLWLILYSLFLGTFSSFFLSTSLSLFLDRFDTALLPYAYIASAVVGYAAVALFSRLARRLHLATLLTACLLCLTALVGAFWAGSMALNAPWLPFLMVACIAPFATLLDLGFWSLATRLFDLRQGKRLFGLVGAGDVVSSIVGYLLIPVLMSFLRRPLHLLPLAAGGLALAVVAVQVMARRFPGTLRTSQAQASRPAGGAEAPRREMSKLVRDPYFRVIAAAMALLVAALYVIDFGFLVEVPQYFDKPARAASFFAVFFGAAKAGELLMKVLASGKLVDQFGIRFGLLALPLVLFASVGLAVAVGFLFGSKVIAFFVLVALTKLSWLVLWRSLYDPSYRVLYQPLGNQQLAFQTGVEGVVKQVGILIMGVLLAVTAAHAVDVRTLFLVLLPLLVLWVAVLFPLHREYRQRLMSALPRTPADATGIPAPLQERFELPAGATGRQAAAALAWIEAVDPAALGALLERLLVAAEPPILAAALPFVGRSRNLGLKAKVERLAGAADLEVRAAAAEALASLRETEQLAASPMSLASLAHSPRPQDRETAALAAGWSKHAAQPLSALLWDHDRTVRRASLLAAGRRRSLDALPRIAAHLDTPGLSSAATAAAAWLGDAVLPELETAFGRAAAGAQRQRLLAIYPRIGTPRAERLLFEKLDFPEFSIRLRTMVLLAAQGFRADADQTGLVKRRLEDLVQLAAWGMAAMLDLAACPAAAATRRSLELDLAAYRRNLYRLLALLHDPRSLRLVRDNLASGSPESAVYAVEILDLLVSADLKPLVLPLLDRLTPAQCLARLDELAPQRRLDAVERLGEILHQPPGVVSLWTKACALTSLGELAAGEDAGKLAGDLIANLYHPDPVLREAAAAALFRADPAAYERHSRKLSAGIKTRLDAVARGEGASSRSCFTRARLFGEAAAFSRVSREILLRMAVLASERRLQAGDDLSLPAESLVLVAAGRLDAAGRLFLADGTPLTAAEPTDLLCLAPEDLLALLADEERLLAPLLAIPAGPASARAAA
jgi:hypothetical protein